MEFKLPNNIEVNTTRNERTQGFLKAVTYLTQTFPVPMNRLEVNFIKRDGVNLNANADYDSVKWEGFFNPIIRVSYGQNGKDRNALNYLFHEYKHLLQDFENRIPRDKSDRPELCIEAQAWADEQLPIYLKTM